MSEKKARSPKGKIGEVWLISSEEEAMMYSDEECIEEFSSLCPGDVFILLKVLPSQESNSPDIWKVLGHCGIGFIYSDPEDRLL